MVNLFDVKKKKVITLLNSSFVNSFRTISSGATYSMKANIVDWNEVNDIFGGMRGQPRNQRVGAIITKPNNLSFLLELVWDDTRDKQHDGDMVYFEEINKDYFNFKRLNPKEVKKRFPAWHPYHHEEKKYLK